MKKEHVDSVIRDIERNMPTIERIIKENLGVEAKFEIKVLRKDGENCVNLSEKSYATRKQMMTPLLKHIFCNAWLILDVVYVEEEDEIVFCVYIHYELSFGGGRNEIELMRFGAFSKNGEVWVRHTTTFNCLSPIRWITTPNDA